MKLKFIEGLRAIHAAGNAKIGPISISIEFYSWTNTFNWASENRMMI